MLSIQNDGSMIIPGCTLNRTNQRIVFCAEKNIFWFIMGHYFMLLYSVTIWLYTDRLVSTIFVSMARNVTEWLLEKQINKFCSVWDGLCNHLAYCIYQGTFDGYIYGKLARGTLKLGSDLTVIYIKWNDFYMNICSVYASGVVSVYVPL